MTSLTRNINPEELRDYVEEIRSKNPDDSLVWLSGECNLEAAQREEAFSVDDKLKANHHAKRAEWYGKLLFDMVSLRTRMEAFTEVLQGRIIVALKEGRRPAWQATHRHYKGTLYRVSGIRQDANGPELVEGVEYDDAAGNRYFLHRDRFESKLDSGKLRYQPLLTGDKDAPSN